MRGTAFCTPSAPNTTGVTAELELIGTEVPRATDLWAVVRQLPVGTIGFLAVGRAPTSLPAHAPAGFGLCLGGALGRYAVAVSDATGTAAALVQPFALPLAQGPFAALAGQRWGWQFVYRDGAGLGVSAARALELR